MNELINELRQSIAEGLRSRTITTCSKWANYRRVMGEETDFPGPFSFANHPWCREISDSQASTNVVMKGAQLGVTEIAINRAFFTIDVLKKAVLYVLPTAGNASDFSKTRFSGACLNSPYIAGLFTDTNTISLKQAGAIPLYIRGSRGDSNLKSIPVSYLILDELDEMDQAVIWRAMERLSGHMDKSIFAISTPTLPKYGIHKLYVKGTMEEWVFQCPHCNKWTELTWPDCIEIFGEDVNDPRCADSYLKCKECGHKLDHETKADWLDTANWHVTNEESGKDHRSFHVNQMYSRTVNPGELVEAYHRGLGDEAANVEFNNSKLGIPYIPEGGQITDDMLDECLANYISEEQRPTGSDRLIVMGVDQGLWHNVEITEYFFDTMSHDLNVAATAKVLWVGKIAGDEFERLDELMRTWQIMHCVIDAEPQINDARRFARRFRGYVSLCRYRRGQTGKEISIQEDDLGASITTVDRTNWLDAALGRFRSKRIMLPRDIGREYREQLKNIVRTYERDELGNPVAKYIETGADHYAHARCYSEIALPLAASYVTNKDIKAFL